MYVHAPLTYIITRLSDTKNFGKPEPFHHYYPRSQSFPNRKHCTQIYHRVLVQDIYWRSLLRGLWGSPKPKSGSSFAICAERPLAYHFVLTDTVP